MRHEQVARRKLDGFDGLRSLAALSVVTYHVALSGAFAHAGSLAPILWELKGGVAIFFVISGALLYLPYARAIGDRATLPDWRTYAGRRAVRILPAYWVALTVVAIGPFGAGVFGPDAGSYYGLSQIYSPQTVLGGLGVAWSLCVEVSFYACCRCSGGWSPGPWVAPAAARLSASNSDGSRHGACVAGPARRARRITDRAAL